MRVIAVIGLCFAIYVVAGMAAAQSPDLPAQKYQVVDTQVVAPSQTRATTSVKLRPLALPNIPALSKKMWKTDRSLLGKQRWKSAAVLSFFDGKGKWLRATAHKKCWEVPWQRSCTIARASYRLHTALAQIATQRLWRELPSPNDWVTSVHLIQRVFPGTEPWLLSCSGAEGGHGRFVVYGGGAYYPGAENDKTFHGDMVGGPMQYMWDTFRGHYRHGLESLRARGFDIRLPAPTDVRAWLSPTAQAIAAGWARWSGNDNSHWSASFGDGC